MIYTIGHSNLPIQDIDRLLVEHDVTCLVDIRSHPTSKWSQYQYEQFAREMRVRGLPYLWLPELGGWRSWHVKHLHVEHLERLYAEGVDVWAYADKAFPKQRIAGSRPPAWPAEGPEWTNQGLFDYSWFTSLAEFAVGIQKLLELGGHPAICCAEVLWWKCHRSMVADYLVGMRLADPVHVGAGRDTPHSEALGDRLERYDVRILEAWARNWTDLSHGQGV